MADNVAVTEGAGKTVATDDIQVDGTHAQGQVQFIKLVDGTLNGTGSVRVNQAAKANAMTVAPASDITDGTYIGDVKFGEALATVTTVSTVTNLAQMGGAAIAMNEGVLAAGVQRVTLATDDDAVAHLATIAGDTTNIETAIQLLDNAVYVDDADWTDNTSSHLLVGGIYQSTDHTVTDGDVSPFQVDVNGCIVLGTSAKVIGKLAANTGVDIGDVDITSIIPLTGATNLGKARDVACGANDVGVMALAVRDDTLTTLTPADGDYAPMRLSSTGQLHVTDANITTCNTGAVVLSSGTVTTVSTVTNLSQLGGVAIAMNEGVLGTGVQRVTLATDDDGVAHLATIAGDTTNIETAIQIIDDWDATHASAAPADGVCIMGAGYSAGLPTDVGADADAARICTDRYGRILRGVMPQNFQATMTSADAQAATPVKTKTADRKMYILSLVVSVDTAMNVQFQDDTGPTVLIEGMYFAANGGTHLTYPPEAPLVVNTNEDFDVIASAAGNISVTITGYLAV